MTAQPLSLIHFKESDKEFKVAVVGLTESQFKKIVLLLNDKISYWMWILDDWCCQAFFVLVWYNINNKNNNLGEKQWQKQHTKFWY